MQLSSYLKNYFNISTSCLKNTSSSKMPNDCLQILLSWVTLKHPISTPTVGFPSNFQFLTPGPYLHLANDVGQPFAARIFAFNWFIGHSICDDEEDFRQIGVVWSKDNWIVAVKKTVKAVISQTVKSFQCFWGRFVMDSSSFSEDMWAGTIVI